MTDQFRWQSALAAAERAIRSEQIEEAVDSLRIALTHIGTLERNDPARIPILEAFLRCCERAVEFSAKQSLSGIQLHVAEAQHIIALAGESPPPLTLRQVFAQLPDDSTEQRRRGKIAQRLHNYQTAANHMLLNSQSAQLGEDSEAVVSTLLALAHLAWGEYGREYDSFPRLQRALAIRERTLGLEHQDTLAIIERLALGHDILIGYRESLPLWERLLAYVERRGALTIRNTRYGITDILFALGKAYNYLRLHNEAKNVWKRYLVLTEQEAQQTTDRLAMVKLRRIDAYYGVGNACLNQKAWHEAAHFLAHAVDNHHNSPFHTVIEGSGISQIDLAQGIAAYAEALAQSDEHDRALLLFEEAIVLHKRRNRQYVKLLRGYATSLRALGNIAKATSIEREAAMLMSSIEANMPRRNRVAVGHANSEIL